MYPEHEARALVLLNGKEQLRNTVVSIRDAFWGKPAIYDPLDGLVFDDESQDMNYYIVMDIVPQSLFSVLRDPRLTVEQFGAYFLNAILAGMKF